MQVAEVDIRPVKEFAEKRLKTDSLLRKVLAAEPDSLPAEEFVGKLGTWLAILREDSRE
jgi:hypothetical protein